MVGAAYAAVPLYRLFCQATGFDGTPRSPPRPPPRCSTGPSPSASTPTCARPALALRARADAPMQVKIGENTLGLLPRHQHLRPARSAAWRRSTCSPSRPRAFFNKLECFCFTEQLLQPGESAGDAGELLRRPADRGRQGRPLGARTSRCPTRSIPWLRRSRGSPARMAVLRHRKRCNAAGKPGRFGVRGLRRDQRCRGRGDQGADRWPTRTPSTTTTTW